MELFVQFSLIILIVFGVSIIMKIFKQPLIIGYIFAGILLGPSFLNWIQGNPTIATFSQIGIAFLLFIVGLNLSPKVIKEVGKISLITGIGQILFTSIIGFLIGIVFGFNLITSFYIAIALTFSSTIIIMKLLSDKDALEKLYGKISIGFLLVQDFIAIILMIILSSLSGGFNAEHLLIEIFIKGTILALILIPLSYYFLPKIESYLSNSQEFLFLFAITWGLGLASLFSYAGFSIEVGALIAGIALSISSYSYDISSRLKPLRDFFIISFFVILGNQMHFANMLHMIWPAIAFSAFILIGNPIIVMALMGYFGYSKHTGFMAGLTVAQISEFSLILIALGVKLGQITNEVLSFVTIIGLITIAGSTYLIQYSDPIYSKISKYLKIFERKKINEQDFKSSNHDYILIGENRTGFAIMNSFIEQNKNYVIVDFNPERVKRLKKNKIWCVYGDGSNIEFLDEIKIDKAKIVVSTVPDLETNMIILNKIREKNPHSIIICTATSITDAIKLYNKNASYVILPHILAGEQVAKLIERAQENELDYLEEKNKQLEDLNKRLDKKIKTPNTN